MQIFKNGYAVSSLKKITDVHLIDGLFGGLSECASNNRCLLSKVASDEVVVYSIAKICKWLVWIVQSYLGLYDKCWGSFSLDTSKESIRINGLKILFEGCRWNDASIFSLYHTVKLWNSQPSSLVVVYSSQVFKSE